MHKTFTEYDLFIHHLFLRKYIFSLAIDAFQLIKF